MDHPPVGPEEWFPHPNLAGVKVSDYGRIQREGREPWLGFLKRGRYYLKYGSKRYCVARLVLETFHNNEPYRGYRFDHNIAGDIAGKGTPWWNDEDKTNNKFRNLCWDPVGPGWTKAQLVERRVSFMKAIEHAEKNKELSTEEIEYIRELMKTSTLPK